MSKKVKDKEQEKFIDKEIDRFQDERVKNVKLMEEVKNQFATRMERELDIFNNLSANPDYYTEALKRIDYDRINQQSEAQELEEVNKTEEENTPEIKEETVVTKEEPVKIQEEVPPVKEEPKKLSFFDKLLRVL